MKWRHIKQSEKIKSYCKGCDSLYKNLFFKEDTDQVICEQSFEENRKAGIQLFKTITF